MDTEFYYLDNCLNYCTFRPLIINIGYTWVCYAESDVYFKYKNFYTLLFIEKNDHAGVQATLRGSPILEISP